jgi:type II secretory pathway pseudopilin PulG
MASSTRARSSPRRLRRGEEGYILLTLLLIVALMAIVATGVLTEIKFEIQRDRELEMIHRGVQYSRAIRSYYKKFGRYPTRLEDLDNTNNLRYLRKHYKDPVNCKNSKCQDFKLLHYGDPGVSLGGSIGGGAIPGATPAGSAMNGPGPGGGSSFGGSSPGGSSFGGSSFGGSSFGGSGSGGSAFGGSSSGSSGVNSSGVFAQSSGSGGNSNNSGSSNTPGTNQTAGTDSAQPGSSGSPDSSSGQSGSGSPNGQGSGGQPFGGGPIVGVASLSKDATIREYNKKKKYNEWQFIYDPTADRGGLITTPYQPALQSFGSQSGIPGAQPAGTNGSAFSNSGSSSFGPTTGSGFGNNSNPNGPAPPAQTPSSPPQ